MKFYSKDNTLIDAISYEGSDEGYSWAKVEGYWQRTKPTPGEENINILKSINNVDYVTILNTTGGTAGAVNATSNGNEYYSALLKN